MTLYERLKDEYKGQLTDGEKSEMKHYSMYCTETPLGLAFRIFSSVYPDDRFNVLDFYGLFKDIDVS
jgi:hypothetical protein